MSARFAELAWAETPIGTVSLRRRRDPMLEVDVYEVKLGEEFLMSSLFTAAEIALTELGLAAVAGDALDVVVGGLGLGYTARAALDDPRVRSLTVVEALGEVVDWHRGGLLPETAGVTSDPRTAVRIDDFFVLCEDLEGPEPDDPCGRFHAVLLDIDHSPRHVLHPSHAAFYSPEGLRRLAVHLHPGGVFALWSDDPPETAFTDMLSGVFATATAHVVAFPNPLTRCESANTVYVARAHR